MTYFKSHNIKSIRLEGDKLVFEYQNSQNETKDINNSELQLIRSYCQQKNLNTLTLSNLEQSSNTINPSNSNKKLYWGLGIAGVLLITVGIIWLVRKNNQNKEE